MLKRRMWSGLACVLAVNVMQRRVDALQALLTEALRTATANARSGATIRLLQDALSIAQLAAKGRDRDALACAESLMNGRPSAACQKYAQSSRDASEADPSNCRQDPELVSRVESILANCNKVTNSICGISREGAACQAKIASIAGSCPSVAAQARELQKSYEATAASVCVNPARP